MIFLGTGFLTAQVYTSRGAIPIEGASISIFTDLPEGRNLLGFRSTDLSGKTSPIPLDAPDRSLSQHPSQSKPFASYILQADHPLYYTIVVKDIQVFDGSTSVQNIEMIPLEEGAAYDQRLNVFPVTPPAL